MHIVDSGPTSENRDGSIGARGLKAAMLAVFALLSLVLIGAEGRETSNRQVAAAPAVPAIPPQADIIGGYVSAYLCLRVRDGVQPSRLADGSWTLRRAAAMPEGCDGGNSAPAADELALRNVLAQHQVTDIRPFFNHQFKRADLAAKYGLNRAYTAYVAPGADVVALNAALANFGALIEHAQLDNVGSIAAIPNDTSFDQQWDMHNTGQTVGGIAGTADADIDCPEAWDIHTGSASTIIAVLDTGVQHASVFSPGSVDHPDLAGKVIGGYNTRDENNITIDEHGHGTHGAGIAAAHGNNGIGVAGTNWNARILAVRVTSAAGSANQDDVAEGVIYAADNGADVISMSLQFYMAVNINLQNAVAYAYDGGTLPVAASGNDHGNVVAWPARYPKCMGIGATTNTDARAGFSNIGPEVDVVAPGANIYGLWRNSAYANGIAVPLQNGTSMATPHVAGLAALLKSYNPALTVPQIEQLVKDTSEDRGPIGWDQEYGWGRINVADALLAAAPDCEGDATGNGVIDVDDLIAVVLSWGACPAPPAPCPADVAPHPVGNGVVDVDDLIAVILRWGAACP